MKYLKMFFATILLFAMTQSVNGQVVSRKALDSTANSATKYITWHAIPTGTAGFTLSGLKSTGTVSGYAILQVSTDTIPTVATRIFEDYVNPTSGRRDTLFFTDIATWQKKDFSAPLPLFFNAARFAIVTSGTQKLYLRALHLKR